VGFEALGRRAGLDAVRALHQSSPRPRRLLFRRFICSGASAPGAGASGCLRGFWISQVAGNSFQNTRNVLACEPAIAAGRSAVERGIVLSPEDRLRHDVIVGLMCRFGVDMAAIGAQHGEVVCRERLGGMLKFYYRKAA
jgi:coproporphyrinogen III oxidase-like Fe-S oxidoreductase